MDGRSSPLDRAVHRRRALLGRSIRDAAVHLCRVSGQLGSALNEPVPRDGLPAVLGLTVRRQRHDAVHNGIRASHSRDATVSQSRYRSWLQSDCGLADRPDAWLLHPVRARQRSRLTMQLFLRQNATCSVSLHRQGRRGHRDVREGREGRLSVAHARLCTNATLRAGSFACWFCTGLGRSSALPEVFAALAATYRRRRPARERGRKASGVLPAHSLASSAP